jgi:hypothetical protein
MFKQVKYISELGRSFDTPGEAITDDKRLPGIIAVYTEDLNKMEGGAKTFGAGPVTPDMIPNWKDTIHKYEDLWEKAKKSWSNFNAGETDV